MRMLILIPALAALSGAPALAADEAAPRDEVQTETRASGAPELSRLDELFADLKRERNERAAERISNRIWEQWRRSGSASVDLMMQWANAAVENKKFDVALDFLDRVTVLKPDYAEGWNRRATVHYMMDDYAKSMADIERTLRLEPRHYGALSGLAAIMKETGRKELALDAYRRVLAVYPMMRSAQKEYSSLAEDLAGEGI